MLPSLPILAGQGFIIRAAQKSIASRVAKDKKAFVLNVSTWLLFPRWALYNVHTLLIIRILKATSSSRSVPLGHQAPDTLSRPLLFPGQAGCFSQWIPRWGRTALTGVLELQWRAVRGKYEKADSFSDIQFFCLLSLTFVVSTCRYLSTFLHFPWVSFSVKWRDWISCFQTVLPGAFWRLGWAPVEGGEEWTMLSSTRRKGLQLKTSGEPGAQALRIMRLHPLWLGNASVIGSASQSPLTSPNTTLEVFLPSIHQSAPVCQALC